MAQTSDSGDNHRSDLSLLCLEQRTFPMARLEEANCKLGRRSISSERTAVRQKREDEGLIGRKVLQLLCGVLRTGAGLFQMRIQLDRFAA